MKAAIVLCLAAGAFAGVRNLHCGGDNCARQVTGTRDGLSPIESRRADCSNFMRTTVVPDPVTTTVTVTVDTDEQPQHHSRRDARLAYPTATAIPTAVPAYASSCRTDKKYSSACSCWGITASITTASPTTKTETVTVTSDFCEDL